LTRKCGYIALEAYGTQRLSKGMRRYKIGFSQFICLRQQLFNYSVFISLHDSCKLF
jgi:hypothetical protein